MMIYTSYYAKYKGANPVSIAGRCPVWYKGREYKKLAPKYDFFKKYKEDGNEAEYTAAFQAQVLDLLDPATVLSELGENAVLLCWEKSGEFCHRHLVAKWLRDKLGIECTEL